MKNSNIILAFIAVLFSLTITAQCTKTEKRKDSVKNIETRLFKAKLKKNKVIKGKPTYTPRGYAISEANVRKEYNEEGLLVCVNSKNYKELTHYNSNNKISELIVIPNDVNDSIVVGYSYDNYGNLKSITVNKSTIEGKNWLSKSYFTSYKETEYINFYENDIEEVKISFDTLKAIDLNKVYRKYNKDNYLIEEKSLTSVMDPLYKYPDSIYNTYKYEYKGGCYNSKLTHIKERINAVFKIKYVNTTTELYETDDEGKIHSTKYLDDDGLFLTRLNTYRPDGSLLEVTINNQLDNSLKKFTYNTHGHLIGYVTSIGTESTTIYTIDYKYNDRGDWIRRIHYDENKKPKYWEERAIEYYYSESKNHF